MKPPCELAVRELLPSLRSAIVRELSESYHMKQTEIAQSLGITQASVSQYLNVERAKETKFASEEFSDAVKKIAGGIAAQKLPTAALVHSMCTLCSELRKSEAFCQMHQDILNVERCDICKT